MLLKKNGVIDIKISKYDKQYDEDIITYKSLNETEDVLSFLSYEIVLEDNFTLRDWFRLIMNYPYLQKLNKFFPSFIEEYNNCPSDNCNTYGYTFINLEKTIELDEDNCYINTGVNLLRDEEHFGIDFAELKSFLDIPIKLNKLTYYNNIKDINKLYIRDISYTLWDFIHSIIWELSYYGIPEDRDFKRNEISDSYDKMKNDE